ncbi:aspartoacylase [Synechococcus sp. Tobar12-5m-g]|uniref:aspartoacylase n=1 Tax=unclassified Synechococcus TaxID=2626047 RepID=UPI0020CB9407|nr:MULTISPECIES: aspartoacylase [unclassified Synechococcus]MCP9772763.1 aspartoacylase [Synechococcus sp. Tobar12-5m-g]MCP9873600.1 aspartoacylase [Synechococcus sp. Cruz CV-v-12]
MAAGRVLVVAGTHGNERNAPWLLEHWRQQPAALEASALALELAIGNPAALAAGVRYIQRDLNRSFSLSLLDDPGREELEVQRARQLIAAHGPGGTSPCPVVLDLHSTTAAMGNSLVLYGRRPADLALAAGIQSLLGLPIYLHEADAAQSGFLVEQWPCGLVIEVGPVPQGVITATVCRQTQLAVEAALAVLAAARAGRLRLPSTLVVHCHAGSLDLPRHSDGRPAACLHPLRQHRDWQPLHPGAPLFLCPDGTTTCQAATAKSPLWPVFINEAAYGEKGIALSVTRREQWSCQPSWAEALVALCEGLALRAP